MPLDEIRRRAGKFQSRILWRNAREYVAALAVSLFFGYQLLHTADVLTGLGFGLSIAGILYLVWHLYRQGSSRSLSEEMGLVSYIEFHRSELERQRDLLRGVWRWYLGPLVPGLAVLMVATARANPGHLRHSAWWLAGYSTLTALLFVFIGRLNARAALRLQHQIEELDGLTAQQ